MRRAYAVILGLYPAEYRATFGQEMREVFEEAAERSSRMGFIARLRFVGRELAGLFAGLVTEWAAKSAKPHGYVTSRCAPRTTPEMPVEGIAEGISVEGISIQISETQRVLKQLIGRMEFAIAHHDFPNARRYSYEERALREHLDRLLSEYRLRYPYAC